MVFQYSKAKLEVGGSGGGVSVFVALSDAGLPQLVKPHAHLHTERCFLSAIVSFTTFTSE